MIISGDLFDQQNRTLRAEVFLKKQFERLEREQILSIYVTVTMILYHQILVLCGQTMYQFSENVETYQTITKNGEEIYLHGLAIK